MKNVKWILVADDATPIAELIKFARAAPEAACEVVVVQNVMDALATLRPRIKLPGRDRAPRVVVLMDLKSSNGDGLAVLRQIKSDHQLKNTPVVLSTSSREVADLVHSYEWGADACVVKPVEFQKLNEILRRLCRLWPTANKPSLKPVQGVEAAPEKEARKFQRN
jgi:CheY-like chemotaxis protein